MSLYGKTDQAANNLIAWNSEKIEQQILPYSHANIEITPQSKFYDFKLMGKNTEIYQHRCAFNMEIEMKRQFLELIYSITIANDPLQVRHSTTDETTYLEVVYMDEVVISVPALAKFTMVMLTRYRSNRIRYDDNQIDVVGDHASIQYVPGDEEYYQIGEETISTATSTSLLISAENGTKLILSQKFDADTTFKVTQNHVEVIYEDEGTVKLKLLPNLTYQKLELRKIEQDEYPSYLHIDSNQCQQKSLKRLHRF